MILTVNSDFCLHGL